MIYISSFEKIGDIPGHVKKFSVARFTPKNVSLPVLGFLDATDINGNKITLKDNNYGDFESKYKEKLKKEWKQVRAWLDSLKKEEDIALLCWCPYSKRGQEEIARASEFFCHTYFIYRLIEKNRPDIKVLPDEDRFLRGWGFSELEDVFRGLQDTQAQAETGGNELCYRLYSEKLGEEIIIAPDDVADKLDEGAVVYSYSEVAELLGAPLDILKEIHEVKKIVKGQIIEIKEGNKNET